MEDHHRVPSAGASGFLSTLPSPGTESKRWGRIVRSRGREKAPGEARGGGGRFVGRLVWLAAGRSPGSCCVLGEAGKRAASRMLPGPRRRVYESVHGGEGQGVCTARARRAPERVPVAAAQRARAAG